MKYSVRLAALLLPLSLFSASPPSVVFLESSLAEARQQAASEGKLYFIHFAANWCMPCQWMEQHSFTDPVLAEYLQEHYLALRIDVDAAEGRVLQKQYAVKVLPTILAFSARGQLLGRHEGALAPEALLEHLQAYDRQANRSPLLAAQDQEGLLSSPRPILSLSRPALMPDVPSAQAPARATPTAARPAPGPTAQFASYRQPTFFSIQAGLFSSYENAVRESAKLEKRSGETAHLSPDNSAGQTVYRIYLGRFDSRERALSHLQQLEQRGVNGFVKEVRE
jgi:thioredoxin-related protein